MLPNVPGSEKKPVQDKIDSKQEEKVEDVDSPSIVIVDKMETERVTKKSKECVDNQVEEIKVEDGSEMKWEEFKCQVADEKVDTESSPFRLVLNAIPERSTVAFSEVRGEFLGVAEIIAPSSPDNVRPPVDIICVLDTSRSMKGTRINLLKVTMHRFISAIHDGDRLGLITFNRTATVALPLTDMSKKARNAANKVVQNLRIRAGTNIEEGLRVGTTMVLERKGDLAKRVCSMIFFTDGEASKGKRTSEELLSTVHDAFNISPSGDPENWTPEDVRRWLASVKLDIPNTVEQFKLMKIDGQILMQDLTETMLEEELGVTSVHIAKFLRELEKLREGRRTEEQPSHSCSINCFGYGNKHNEQLLGQLATNFDGLYYYVKDPLAISEGFATCLGGIISTCATNLELSLTPVNGAKDIVLVSNFPELKKTKVERESATVRLGDIQEEEHRHIVFKFTLPAESSPTQAAPTYIAVKLAYVNAITAKIEATVASLEVERGLVTSARSDKVDAEFNREEALRALTTAEAIAKSGRLGEARKILLNTSNSINTSSSNRYPLSLNLVKDLDTSMRGYQDHKSYSSWGRTYSKQNQAVLRSERACAVSDRSYNTQKEYLTSSKRATAEIFRNMNPFEAGKSTSKDSKKKSSADKGKSKKKTPKVYRLSTD